MVVNDIARHGYARVELELMGGWVVAAVGIRLSLRYSFSSFRVYHWRLHKGMGLGERNAPYEPAQTCCIGLSSDPCPSWGTACCWRNLASSLGLIDSHRNASFRGAGRTIIRLTLGPLKVKSSWNISRWINHGTRNSDNTLDTRWCGKWFKCN